MGPHEYLSGGKMMNTEDAAWTDHPEGGRTIWWRFLESARCGRPTSSRCGKLWRRPMSDSDGGTTDANGACQLCRSLSECNGSVSVMFTIESSDWHCKLCRMSCYLLDTPLLRPVTWCHKKTCSFQYLLPSRRILNRTTFFRATHLRFTTKHLQL